MSYRKIPAKIIYGSKSIQDYYEGFDGDSGYYLFQVKDPQGGTPWIMTESFLSFSFTDSAGTISGLYRIGDYDGEPSYTSTSGGWMLYYVASMGKWILMQNAPYYGYIPRTTAEADTDYDTGVTTYTYTGDIWWEATSFDTMPYNGATAGTFNFALTSWQSTYTNLSQYASIVHTFTGDVSSTYYKKIISGSGPAGVYEGGRVVGISEWTFTWKSRTQRIIKYGDDYREWMNLTRYRNIRYVEDHYLNTRWTGWVAESTLGAPNADPEKGFYAVESEPIPTNNFTLKWFHFVPDDPDDPDSDGDIVQEDSWTDKDGVVHQMPNITVTWDDVKSYNTTNINKLRILGKVPVCEVAIWR